MQQKKKLNAVLSLPIAGCSEFCRFSVQRHIPSRSLIYGLTSATAEVATADAAPVVATPGE